MIRFFLPRGREVDMTREEYRNLWEGWKDHANFTTTSLVCKAFRNVRDLGKK